MIRRLRRWLGQPKAPGRRTSNRTVAGSFVLVFGVGLAGTITAILVPGNGVPPITPGGPIRHVVWIYDENHSFDNLMYSICQPHASNEVTVSGSVSGTTTLTATSGSFTSAQVGRAVAGPDVPYGTRIASFTDATHVVMSLAATGTTTGSYAIGQDPGRTAGCNVSNSASISNGNTITAPLLDTQFHTLAGGTTYQCTSAASTFSQPGCDEVNEVEHDAQGMGQAIDFQHMDGWDTINGCQGIGTTASITSGSNVLTATSAFTSGDVPAGGFVDGAIVSGPGIPPQTYIAELNTNSQAVLSNNATATTTNGAFTYGYWCLDQYDKSMMPNLTSLADTYALADNSFMAGPVQSWGAHLNLALGGIDDGFRGNNPGGSPLNWGCVQNPGGSGTPGVSAWLYNGFATSGNNWGNATETLPNGQVVNVAQPTCIPGPSATIAAASVTGNVATLLAAPAWTSGGPYSCTTVSSCSQVSYGGRVWTCTSACGTSYTGTTTPDRDTGHWTNSSSNNFDGWVPAVGGIYESKVVVGGYTGAAAVLDGTWTVTGATEAALTFVDSTGNMSTTQSGAVADSGLACSGTGPWGLGCETANVQNSPVPWAPTVFDRLDGNGLTWRIYGDPNGPNADHDYIWNTCTIFADCTYTPQLDGLVDTSQILTDGANGTLPNFSLVTPDLIGPALGAGCTGVPGQLTGTTTAGSTTFTVTGGTWNAGMSGKSISGPGIPQPSETITYVNATTGTLTNSVVSPNATETRTGQTYTVGNGNGQSTSEHNGDSLSVGDNWLGCVVHAIESGPEWNTTTIFVTWDDCGCFYDHVAPPRSPTVLTGGQTGNANATENPNPIYGPRTPVVIISPYTKRTCNGGSGPSCTGGTWVGTVDSHEATSTGILTYTEHTFGIQPLTVVDARSYDFAASFDFTQTPHALKAPLVTVPASPGELDFAAAHPNTDGDT